MTGNGISSQNSAPGFKKRRQEGLALTVLAWELLCELVNELKAEFPFRHVYGTLENTKEAAKAWAGGAKSKGKAKAVPAKRERGGGSSGGDSGAGAGGAGRQKRRKKMAPHAAPAKQLAKAPHGGGDKTAAAAAHRAALQTRMDAMGGWRVETRERTSGSSTGGKDTYWKPPQAEGQPKRTQCRSWKKVEEMLDRIDAEMAE